MALAALLGYASAAWLAHRLCTSLKYGPQIRIVQSNDEESKTELGMSSMQKGTREDLTIDLHC